jgi:hypothetical protein
MSVAPAAEAVTPLDSATAISYEQFHPEPVADRARAAMPALVTPPGTRTTAKRDRRIWIIRRL